MKPQMITLKLGVGAAGRPQEPFKGTPIRQYVHQQRWQSKLPESCQWIFDKGVKAFYEAKIKFCFSVDHVNGLFSSEVDSKTI